MDFDRRQLLAAGGASLALTALPAKAAAPANPGTRLLDAIAEDMLRLSPKSATDLGIDKGARAGLRAKSSDLSKAGRADYMAMIRRRLADLEKLDTAKLDPATRTDVEIVKTAFATGVEGDAFGYGDVSVGGWRNGPYVVAQNMGSYLDTPKFLDSSHVVKTSADADAYVARLDDWAANLDGETERMAEARGLGVIAPAVTLDKTLAGLRATRGSDVTKWPVLETLYKPMRAVTGGHGAKAAKITKDKIAPALERQIAELEKHRAAATDDAGIWRIKDGDAFYAWALRAATTTRRTPDEVHRQGLDEIKTLQAEMDSILKGLGYTKGTVGERMQALGRDKRFLFSEGDKGRAEIMAEIQRRLADIRTRMPRAFTTLSRGNVEVKRISPAEEMGAPGAYGGPGSLDGSIPGRFFINLSTPARHTRYDLPTLCYHEAIPGHVWQGEYNQKLSLIRSMMGFSAYGEGWGLYAEQLGAELGAYEGDPVGRLGYLQSMGFRACRLVVDTGMHAKRWTRQRAIDWFVSTNGSGVAEVTGEIDRYCVWPGQACAYKIGHSEINRLRTLAQTQLGPRYDFKAYNELVIGGGSMPLTLLDARVRGHIAARKG